MPVPGHFNSSRTRKVDLSQRTARSVTNDGAVIGQLLQSGFGNLAAYLAAHVLLCLVPAFFIAGAMAALIPQEAVTRFLGRDAPKAVSYWRRPRPGRCSPCAPAPSSRSSPASTAKGAGLRPAITFLFFAPAVTSSRSRLHGRRDRRWTSPAPASYSRSPSASASG